MTQNSPPTHSSGTPARPSATSAVFLATLVGWMFAIVLLIGMPMAYLGILPFDLWTMFLLALALLVLGRFFREPKVEGADPPQETWEEYSIGMVHEVKNQLMDFHPEHHGSPEGLADYLEGTKQVLTETIEHLREISAQSGDSSAGEAEEPGDLSSNHA